ncbi:MAG: DNA polymerase I [Butyrivibrio sp.]|nr:DNA polymerase I [Butyrivibrio sp.]
MKKILLIDGHSILNRAFYGVPLLTNHEGVHTNAVYGFINIMLKALEEETADYVAVAFDLKAPTFRHKMYEAYKGTRKPMPQELHEQVPIIKDVLAAMTIPVVTMEGYEADDILGTLAKRSQAEGFEVSILTGDRDILQIADEHIKIRMPKTTKGKTEIENYYPADVVAKYGVTPTEFIDLKALMGDTSDNIPGVPGIGEKTATAIISKYKSIEAAHEAIDEITPAKAKNNLAEYYEQAVLSKTLATIDINAPVEFDIELARIENLFTEEAYNIFAGLELKSLLKKFDMTQVGEKIAESVKYSVETGNAEEIVQSGDIGLALCVAKGRIIACAITDEHGTYCFAGDKLTETVTKLSSNCRVRAINIKNKLEIIEGIGNMNIDDLAIMAYLINPLKDSYLYDDIATQYLGMELLPRTAIAGKICDEDLFSMEPDKLNRILAFEAYTAYYAYPVLVDKLKDMEMLDLYEKIEKPVMHVLRSMEIEGISVDREALKNYSEELGARIEILENRIYELAGEKFNINSPKQLGEILFEKLNLPNGKKTKTGYSTAADVLEKLAGEHEVVSCILEYRTLAKLKSTYADGLVDFIAEDGRIHSTFNQTITATGRLSSTEPNLQNIPIRLELGRKIRKVFIPKPGYSFVDADYSQIELRLLAHMSGDEELIRAYNEDSDIHRITASKVFKTPLEEVTPRQRSNAKAVNFGIVYGISSFGLSRDLDITKQEAKQYIDEYFKTYPSIKAYLDRLVADAKELGYAKTVFNRRRPVPELSSGNFMQKQFGERIAMNSPLQGTAADIIKIAMINVFNRLKAEGLKSRLILQIHDELLIETADDEIDTVKKILAEEMKGAAKLLVPLEIDVHSAKDWYEAK